VSQYLEAIKRTYPGEYKNAPYTQGYDLLSSRLFRPVDEIIIAHNTLT
jgi:hemin uptake protein HemP